MSMCKYNYSYVHTGSHILVCHTQETKVRMCNNVTNVRKVSRQHDVIDYSVEFRKAVFTSQEADQLQIGTNRFVPSPKDTINSRYLFS